MAVCRRGKLRQTALIKTYACLFVCMAARAVHLELLSDLSSALFLAGFTRFSARRRIPATITSDNGSNILGANKELGDVYKLILQSSDDINKQLLQPVEWHFSPASAPHFGGLWEARVRAMKALLRKNLGPYPLSFEELSTLLMLAESILNSRPLTPVDSVPVDGVPALTPGHFLIGRPLLTPPFRTSGNSLISLSRRWKLVNQLSQDLWEKWQHTYLQSLGQAQVAQDSP